MPDDIPELCCAFGSCCNETKRRVELAKLLKHAVPHLSDAEATAVSNFMHDNADMVEKSLGLGVFLHKFAEDVRAHPYT